MAIQQKATTLLSLRASCILALAFFGTGQPAKAETTYNVNCKVLGDSISLTSTGAIVLEQRLVEFKPIESNNYQRGQRGVCVIKKDPPGYRWIPCWKQGGKLATGNPDYPSWITPKEAIANAVQHRGWRGACKVKL